MSITSNSPANLTNNVSSNEIITRPNLPKKEVLCTVVVDCTYRMEAHFKKIYTNYLIPYFSHLRHPLTFNIEGKTVKITPTLKISIILYRSYDAVNEATMKYFLPVDNMDFVKKVFENIEFSWSNYRCSAATEGLCQALSIHENYNIKGMDTIAEKPTRHCILIGNTNPDTARSHLNYDYKYDDLSLDDICKRMNSIETNFSIITPNNNLTELHAIQNKINGNKTQVIEYVNDKCLGYVVKIAGLSFKENSQFPSSLKLVSLQEKRMTDEVSNNEAPDSKSQKVEPNVAHTSTVTQPNQYQNTVSSSTLSSNIEDNKANQIPNNSFSSPKPASALPLESNQIQSPARPIGNTEVTKIEDLTNNNTSIIALNQPISPSKPKRQPSKSGKVAINKKQTPKNPPKMARKASSKRGSISGPTPSAIPSTTDEKNVGSIPFTNAGNNSNAATPAPQMTPNYGASNNPTPMQVGSVQNTPSDFNNLNPKTQTPNSTAHGFISTQSNGVNFTHPISNAFNGENMYATNFNNPQRPTQNNMQNVSQPNQQGNHMTQTRSESSQRVRPNQVQNPNRNGQNLHPSSLPQGINLQASRNLPQQQIANASPGISGTPNSANNTNMQHSSQTPTLPLNAGVPIWSGELGFHLSASSPLHSAYANVKAFPLANSALNKDELMVDKWPKRLLISRTVSVPYATIIEATKAKGLPIFMISSINDDTSKVYSFMLEKINDGTAMLVDLVQNAGGRFGFLLMKNNDKFIVVAFLKSPFPDFGGLKPSIQPNINANQAQVPTLTQNRPTNAATNVSNNPAFKPTLANIPPTANVPSFNGVSNPNQVVQNGSMGFIPSSVNNSIGMNSRSPNDLAALSQHMALSGQVMANRTPNMSNEAQSISIQNAPTFNNTGNNIASMNKTVTPNNGLQPVQNNGMLQNNHLNIQQPGNMGQLAPNQLNILRQAAMNNMINPAFNGSNGIQAGNMNLAMGNPSYNPAMSLNGNSMINPLLPNNQGFMNPQMYMNPEMMQLAQQNRGLQQFGMQNMSQQQLHQLSQMQNNPRQFNQMN